MGKCHSSFGPSLSGMLCRRRSRRPSRWTVSSPGSPLSSNSTNPSPPIPTPSPIPNPPCPTPQPPSHHPLFWTNMESEIFGPDAPHTTAFIQQNHQKNDVGCINGRRRMCMHTSMHTRICVRTRSHTKCAHTQMHVVKLCTHTHTHIVVARFTHTHTHAHTHTHTLYGCMQLCVCTHMHTRASANTHTHTHTHTHVRENSQFSLLRSVWTTWIPKPTTKKSANHHPDCCSTPPLSTPGVRLHSGPLPDWIKHSVNFSTN